MLDNPLSAVLPVRAPSSATHASDPERLISAPLAIVPIVPLLNSSTPSPLILRVPVQVVGAPAAPVIFSSAWFVLPPSISIVSRRGIAQTLCRDRRRLTAIADQHIALLVSVPPIVRRRRSG